MDKLLPADLFSLEEYHARRPEFRERVLAHKRDRQVALGDNATLYFEDRLTIHYQIQEMLRVERIFEADAIAEELAAYNPLIPDGENLKATFMLEYGDPDERRRMLAQLVGVEDRIWIEADSQSGPERVFAIADEDMERTTQEKTSSVHFLRFELTSKIRQAFLEERDVRIGIDHDACRIEKSLHAKSRKALSADLK